MADTNQTGTRRARRSTEASRRLARARARNAEQLAAQRDAEKRVDGALREYVVAGERIADAEKALTEKLAEQHRVRQRLTELTELKVSSERGQQARAALTIHESSRTVEQVADLLEVSVKAARALIAAGRQTGATTLQADTGAPAADAAGYAEVGEPVVDMATRPSDSEGAADTAGESAASELAAEAESFREGNGQDRSLSAAVRGAARSA